ncbi:pentatricopeptide repeat-containing protein At2g29760, chloroplastic-like [Nymphaea colorata]|uniref:DYW domain-containing protein n=1 Tax=Nymphaea colorata TaxID=210225 RepID=A0A5K0VCN2_9MAGN|nr:pentatricopeptide repeat-containing protein At2g29760, chloroplastic-like [Nymphaea colorata]
MLRPKHCIELFRLLRRVRASFVHTNHFISIDYRTQCVIPLIGRIVTADHFCQLHCHLIVTGIIADGFLASKLLASPALPDLHHAHKVFRQIERPNLFSWNTMINVARSEPTWPFSLYREMRVAGISPDSHTFLFLIRACIARSDGEQAHCNVVKMGFGSSEFVACGIIGFYVGCGIVDCARRLFDEIPQRGIVMWTSMIRGYVCENQYMEALELFSDMETAGVVPDAVTMATILPACCQLKELSVVRKLHGSIRKRGFETDAFVAIELSGVYADCEDLESSFQVFYEMPHKDVVAWNSMIHQCVKSGATDMACDLFGKMVKKDIISWNTLIAGLAGAGRHKQALALFNDMGLSGVKPNSVTMLPVLSSCAGLGALGMGMWVHSFIEKNSLNLDGFLDCAIIDMYSKCGSVDRALQIFSKVHKRGLLTWTSMICGLAMHGRGQDALHLFSCMQQLDVKPDGVTFLGLLSACAHAGLTSEGRRLFYMMEKMYEIRPEIEHYGCMVDIFGRAGRLTEAHQLISEMPFEPNPVIWGALLSACRVHNNVELGEIAAERLLELDPTDCGIHVLLSNIYAEAAKWDGVRRLRKEQKTKGKRKAPGCSSIDVDGIVHEFLAGDDSHSQLEEIHSLLEMIDKQMCFPTDVNVLYLKLA